MENKSIELKSFSSIFWPTFIEVAFFMLMGTLDTIQISHYSDNAVAAINVSGQVIGLFGILLAVSSIGVSVAVSQWLGNKKPDNALYAIGTGLILNTIIGLIISSALFFAAKALLTLINTDPVIIEDSIKYLKITAVSLFFVSISNIISASLRAYGKAHYITIVSVFANVFNFAGNYVLIYGKLGFPSLGVTGAAISTFIGRFLILAIYIVLLFVVIKMPLKSIRLHVQSTRIILKIGVPAALESFIYNVMNFVILGFVNSLGLNYTIARGYYGVLVPYFACATSAFGSTNAVFVGYYVGKRDFKKAYERTMKTMLINSAVVTIFLLAVNIPAKHFLRLFTDNEEIITITRNALLVEFVLEFGRVLNTIFIQALRATGDPFIVLVYSFFSMLIVGIGMAYLFGIVFDLKLTGIYIGITIDECLRGVLGFLRWHSHKWESKTKYLDNREGLVETQAA